MKRHLITALKCFFSIAILTYLFNKAIHEDQFEKLFSSETNWGWLVVGFLACLSANIISFLRWQIMVKAIGLPFSVLDAFRIGFICVFFNLFAFGVVGGDVLRAFYVTREFKNRKSEAIASVIADRLIGIMTMLVVATLAFWFLDVGELETKHPEKWASISAAGQVITTITLVGLGMFGVILFTKRIGKAAWFKRILAIPTLGSILKKIIAVVSVYRNRPGAMAASFLLSVGINVCFAVSIYSIAIGLFDDSPTIGNHFVIGPIALVSNAVPLPGGLGGMELAVHLLYQVFDCDHGVVVAFTFRFCLLTVSAMGAFVWFFNRGQVKDLIEEGERSKPHN